MAVELAQGLTQEAVPRMGAGQKRSDKADAALAATLAKFSQGDRGAYLVTGTRGAANGVAGIVLDSREKLDALQPDHNRERPHDGLRNQTSNGSAQHAGEGCLQVAPQARKARPRGPVSNSRNRLTKAAASRLRAAPRRGQGHRSGQVLHRPAWNAGACLVSRPVHLGSG